jgi:hypothetical protein
MSSVWTTYVTTWELLQNADAVAYFDAIEANFGDSVKNQDGDWKLRQWFFDAIEWWWNRKCVVYYFQS